MFNECFKPYYENEELVQFETYGEYREQAVKKAEEFAKLSGTKAYQHIWTVVDSEDGDLIAINGWHSINRLYYIVCENHWGQGDDNDSDLYIESDF